MGIGRSMSTGLIGGMLNHLNEGVRKPGSNSIAQCGTAGHRLSSRQSFSATDFACVNRYR